MNSSGFELDGYPVEVGALTEPGEPLDAVVKSMNSTPLLELLVMKVLGPRRSLDRWRCIFRGNRPGEQANQPTVVAFASPFEDDQPNIDADWALLVFFRGAEGWDPYSTVEPRRVRPTSTAGE